MSMPEKPESRRRLGRRLGRQSGRARLIGRGMISAADAVVLDLRPSVFMIPVRSIGPIVLLGFAGYWLMRGVDLVWVFWAEGDGLGSATEWFIMVWGSVVIVVLCVVMVAIDYATRRYVLTERRAFSVVGVVDQRIGEIGLDRLESLVISKPLLVRIFGMGHLRLASAGTDGFTVQWRYLRGPERVAARVRQVQGKGAA